MIRRLGYLDTENPLDKTDTGFFTDDEDIEESKGYEWDSLIKYNELREVTNRYRYTEFNEENLKFVCNDSYKLKINEFEEIPEVEINYKNDLIRQRTARDPAGRGSKMFRETLRGNVEVVDPSGNVVKCGYPTKKR